MVKGFEVAHQKYGRLPWKMLFETAAKIAEKGFTVTEATRHAYVQRERHLKSPKYSTLRLVLLIIILFSNAQWKDHLRFILRMYGTIIFVYKLILYYLFEDCKLLSSLFISCIRVNISFRKKYFRKRNLRRVLRVIFARNFCFDRSRFPLKNLSTSCNFIRKAN